MQEFLVNELWSRDRIILERVKFYRHSFRDNFHPYVILIKYETMMLYGVNRLLGIIQLFYD